MPTTLFNSAGEPIENHRDSMSATQNANVTKVDRDKIAGQDAAFLENAQMAKVDNNLTEMQKQIAQIHDPQKRLVAYNTLLGRKGLQGAPAGVYSDGDGGIKDANTLFFMMVFY